MTHINDSRIEEIVRENVSEDKRITDDGIVALYRASQCLSVEEFVEFWCDRVPQAAAMYLRSAGVPRRSRIAELTGAK